jgi:8-oxo-dGTP diphosphatase
MDDPAVPAATAVIHAAGGLLWRRGRDERELAVIRRDRYGEEWTLPKGKLDRGESWEAAAVREVREETGCAAERGAFAGGQVYEVDGRPKVVLYWHMRVVRQEAGADPAEVIELCWLTPDRARARLTHLAERRLLADALATAPSNL